MKKQNMKNFSVKVLSIVVVLTFMISILGYVMGSNLSTSKYQHVADLNTMEDYKDKLITKDNGTRYAGRVWADKSVQAKGTNNNELQLHMNDDASTETVGYNTDFLHIFSTIGSSQVVNQYTSRPIDVVLLLDISSSMTHKTGDDLDDEDNLHQVIKETNTLINQLMGNDPALKVHEDNRVGIVVYGGGSQVLLPLDHYTTTETDDSGKAEYIKVDSEFTDRENDHISYFPKITTKVSGKKNSNYTKTSDVMVADSTYLQAALYQGMDMLATEETTTAFDKVTKTQIPRTPVLITLTDGATNIVSASETSNSSDKYDWYKPLKENEKERKIVGTDGVGAQYAKPGENPVYTSCNTATGTVGNTNKETEVQAITPRNVSNLLLAGYYKNKITSHYNTQMINYSIGYNVGFDPGVSEGVRLS